MVPEILKLSGQVAELGELLHELVSGQLRLMARVQKLEEAARAQEDYDAEMREREG